MIPALTLLKRNSEGTDFTGMPSTPLTLLNPLKGFYPFKSSWYFGWFESDNICHHLGQSSSKSEQITCSSFFVNFTKGLCVIFTKCLCGKRYGNEATSLIVHEFKLSRHSGAQLFCCLVCREVSFGNFGRDGRQRQMRRSGKIAFPEIGGQVKRLCAQIQEI